MTWPLGKVTAAPSCDIVCPPTAIAWSEPGTGVAVYDSPPAVNTTPVWLGALPGLLEAESVPTEGTITVLGLPPSLPGTIIPPVATVTAVLPTVAD